MIHFHFTFFGSIAFEHKIAALSVGGMTGDGWVMTPRGIYESGLFLKSGSGREPPKGGLGYPRRGVTGFKRKRV